ncbi:MAG TPA: hypothetical protein VFK47_03705 [Ktedonobacteraceae bacterium]|nr:hypothetical protein [Ktedonobacteraceae bacterium]
MTASLIPLTALSEAQRAQALERFAIIRPALEEGIAQAQGARPHQMVPGMVQLWIKRSREKGLFGLANSVARSEKGKSRRLPTEAVWLIKGLALQTPPRSAASIHRQVSTIAKEQGWPPPAFPYSTVGEQNQCKTILPHGTRRHQGTRKVARASKCSWSRNSPYHRFVLIWLLVPA